MNKNIITSLNYNDAELKRELTFDQYGRYAIIKNIINENRKPGEKFKILDVGGRGNFLKRFFPNDDVFFLDPYLDIDDNNFIKGDGCAMDLGRNSFDWVTSADVFEHIPEEKREVFLKENIRVAKVGVILAAPFFSREIHEAEKNANENYKTISNGEDYIWLKEHLDNGLPLEKILEDFLITNNLEFQKIHNNMISLWELFIVIAIVSEKYPNKVAEKLKDFNYFYNSEIFPYDLADPSYRKIYFIKKAIGLNNLKFSNKKIDEIIILKVIKMGLDILMNIIKIENSPRINNPLSQKDTMPKFIKRKGKIIFLRLRERCLNSQVHLRNIKNELARFTFSICDILKILKNIKLKKSKREEKWKLGITDEVIFWDTWFLNKGGSFKNDYKNRMDENLPLQDHIVYALKKINVKSNIFSILDVGAGPLTILGKKHPDYEFLITAIDPLANDYKALIKKYNIQPIVNTELGYVEKLAKKFKENSFDLVHIQNALDHSIDPIKGIGQMLKVVKRGGIIIISSAIDEATNGDFGGFHQWNFRIENNRFIIEGKDDIFDIENIYGKSATIEVNTLEKNWMLAIMQKNK